MSDGQKGYPVHSREERLADAVLHIVGVVSALISVPVIVTLAAVWYGDSSTVGAALIYGIGLLAMLACSAWYHMAECRRLKQMLQRLDHAAIYLKIAATYTLLAALSAGEAAREIMVAIWTAAVLGMSLKAVSATRWEWLTLALYFAMGWAALVIGGPILEGAAPASLALMISAGALFSVGVVFLYWPGLRFRFAIWHGFVLAGSFLIYAAMVIEVVRRAPEM